MSGIRASVGHMTDVVVFHHAQGLTPGVLAFADELRGRGHRVTTPDLYDGHTFATLDEGIAFAQETGFGTIVERGIHAAATLPEAIVYAGFSLGVMPAQQLAQTRPHAKGALLCCACLPVSEFGDAWPRDVPVQVHAMDADPLFTEEGDLDAARELVASTDVAELFTYPGGQHLFADASLPDYDEQAAALFTHRVLDFLEKL
jgi:dienelactone hydrolase